MKLHHLPAVAALTFAGAASAATYNDVDTVVISDFTGRLMIEVGGPAVQSEIIEGTEDLLLTMTHKDGRLVIDGPDRPKNFKLHKEIGWNFGQDDAFEEFIDKYPVLKLTLPTGTALTLDEAITIAAAGDLEGDLTIEGGHVEAAIGDVESADVELRSSRDIAVGHVREMLRAGVRGSGDFSALSARAAKLSISGSGDMEVGPVADDATLSVAGSGDIRVGDIGGPVKASISGSGDIALGAIGGGASLQIAGSGDIEAGSVNGETTAQISGSGDIHIDEGRAQDLDVSVTGSGDFVFGGVSTNLDAAVRGSGLISVAANEGDLRTSQKGDIRVGGRRVNAK